MMYDVKEQSQSLTIISASSDIANHANDSVPSKEDNESSNEDMPHNLKVMHNKSF